MIYQLKIKDSEPQQWEAAPFGAWLLERKELAGHNFETRLQQLRAYTGEEVINWSLEEGAL